MKTIFFGYFFSNTFPSDIPSGFRILVKRILRTSGKLTFYTYFRVKKCLELSIFNNINIHFILDFKILLVIYFIYIAYLLY